jgi:hypothetical protein
MELFTKAQKCNVLREFAVFQVMVGRVSLAHYFPNVGGSNRSKSSQSTQF